MKRDNKRIQTVSRTAMQWKQNKSHFGWEPFRKSDDFKLSPGHLWLLLLLQKWLSFSLNMSVFTHLASELSNCKYRWGEPERGEVGGSRRRRSSESEAWGLLGPTEGIVICNIHSNVPYQMQWVRRCSGMEISLVPHSAVVTPRANSDKWIYSDNTYGTLAIQRDAWSKQWRDVKQRGPCLQSNPPSVFFSYNNKQLSAFYFHAASGWLSHFILTKCTF